MRKCPAKTPSGPKSCITVRSLKFHSKKGPKVWYFTLNKFLDTIFQQSLVAIFFEINEMLRQILKACWKISNYSHIQFWCQITQSSSISLGVKISKFESIWEHTFALKNTAYSQLNKKKLACLTQIFWNTKLGVTCIAIRICINIYDSFKIEGCAGFFLTMP